jgi:hypothetical protein
MSDVQTPEPFVSLQRAAARLGLPIAWLREEARAGRVPHLRVGRRLLFNSAAVERSLSNAPMNRKGAAMPEPNSGKATVTHEGEGRLRDDLCPIVAGRRLIPPELVPVIALELRRKGIVVQEEAQSEGNGNQFHSGFVHSNTGE